MSTHPGPGTPGDPAVDAVVLNLIDLEAVATLTGIGSRTIYRMIDAGEFPRPGRFGRKYKWRRSDILNWMDDRIPRPAPSRRRKA